MELSPAEKAPAFDRKGASVLDYERQVRLWMRSTKTDPAGSSSSLALHMNSAPRQVCLPAGGGHLDDQEGVTRFLEILPNFRASGAAGAIYRQVARLTQYRRAEQFINEFIVESDLLRRKAESKMDMGSGYPEQFASKLRMNNAGLYRQEESLVMASSHKSLMFEDAAANTRR